MTVTYTSNTSGRGTVHVRTKSAFYTLLEIDGVVRRLEDAVIWLEENRTSLATRVCSFAVGKRVLYNHIDNYKLL